MVYHQEKGIIVLVYLPAVLVVVLFHTLLAIPYGILLWWLHKDIEELLNMHESVHNVKN